MNEDTVKKIITDALKSTDEDPNINEDWDSLAHISILVALDTAFEGRINQLEALQKAYSTERIIDILKENGLVDQGIAQK